MEIEKITLRKHDFEQIPLEEEVYFHPFIESYSFFHNFFYLLKLFKKQPERETGVILSNPMEEKPKTKRPKVPKLKTDSEPKKEQVVPSIIEILS